MVESFNSEREVGEMELCLRKWWILVFTERKREREKERDWNEECEESGGGVHAKWRNWRLKSGALLVQLTKKAPSFLASIGA